MKAAVIYQKRSLPEYVADYPEPVTRGEDELMMSVKAVAVKHLDKSRDSGKHYSTRTNLSRAKVAGGDAAGFLEDGRRVFALGVDGTLSEKAAIEERTVVPIPDGLSTQVAAALPNAVAGSAMALRFRADLRPGETVLINGATGFTGKIAVQLANYYGAGKIVATGRDPQSLESLLKLGADEIISLPGDGEALTESVRDLHRQAPFDVILDYLWGQTAECILDALRGKGSYFHKTRFVSIGAVTGDTITLSAETLRSTDIQLCGSGLGSWTKPEMHSLFKDILPDIFRLAAEGRLQVETIDIKLENIQQLWDRDAPKGKRFVVTL